MKPFEIFCQLKSYLQPQLPTRSAQGSHCSVITPTACLRCSLGYTRRQTFPEVRYEYLYWENQFHLAATFVLDCFRFRPVRLSSTSCRHPENHSAGSLANWSFLGQKLAHHIPETNSKMAPRELKIWSSFSSALHASPSYQFANWASCIYRRIAIGARNRSLSHDATIDSHIGFFVMGRSKIAPIKQQSIPRLELDAAVLGVRLSEFIQSSLRIPLSSVTFWTDSTTVPAWIKSDSKQKTYVSHRIKEILEKNKYSTVASCTRCLQSSWSCHSRHWNGKHRKTLAFTSTVPAATTKRVGFRKLSVTRNERLFIIRNLRIFRL